MSRMAQHLKSLDSWRTQYNPLRGLTLPRAVGLLEAGMRGEYADLMWTYEFIEQTDADLLALVERRTSALCEMDWNIKIVQEDFKGYSKALAEDQAEELRAAYDRIDNLYEAMEHLELGAFRGFSHVQPHLDPDGRIAHLEPLDHWNFVRDGRYGQWAWSPSGRAISFAAVPPGDILEPDQFIIREVRRPIDRIGLIKFVRANLSEKDWDAYIEIYGIPPAFIIGPEDVPEGKETTYRDAAEDAAEGRGGYLPYGSDVKFPNEQRGSQPFELRLDYLSKKLVLAGTGGMLTMLTESGSGTLAGGAHAETFNTIARSEARKISELFQIRIDRRVLDEKFSNKPRLAYFAIAAEEEQDIGELCDHFQKLSSAGLAIDPEDASERTGYKLTAKAPTSPEQPVQLNRGITLNRDTAAAAIGDRVDARLKAASIDELAKAMARDLAPVRDRIEAALALEDDQAMIDALLQIPGDGPALLLQICRDPLAARALEHSMTAALFNGLAEGVAARTPPPPEVAK